MLRYLAAIWHPRDSEHRRIVRQVADSLANSPQWHSADQCEDFRVWTSDVRPGLIDAHILPDHSGIILGTVFNRSDASKPARLATFTKEECERIKVSAGRSLVKQQWGRYVAILRSPSDGTIRALRDPTAGVPCYYFESKGVWFILSDPEDAAECGVLPICFNHDYLIAHAIMPGIACEETSLTGLRELLGGQCITLRNERLSSEYYWHPAEYAQGTRVDDPATAALQVERLTRYGVESYAALHPRILLLASGGVDSSIVAACLQRTASNVIGFSAYADNPAGDERRYSRLLRDSTGFEWIECPSRAVALDVQPPRAARPRLIYSAPQERQFIAAAKSRNARAIASGQGGDGIFYECREHATEDHFETHGFHGLLTAARRSAKLKRTSVTRELRRAFGQKKQSLPHPLAEALRFAKLVSTASADRVLQQRERFTHGWLQSDTQSLTTGQRRHIRLLIFPFARALTWMPGGPDLIDPLLNQLLMEFLLPMRAHTLLHGGRTRALARMAFAPYLPASIIQRTDKGNVRGDMKALRRANLPAMRDKLLNGYLAESGIVDGLALRDCLSDTPTEISPTLALNHYCMELAVREWLRTKVRPDFAPLVH